MDNWHEHKGKTQRHIQPIHVGLILFKEVTCTNTMKIPKRTEEEASNY